MYYAPMCVIKDKIPLKIHFVSPQLANKQLKKGVINGCDLRMGKYSRQHHFDGRKFNKLRLIKRLFLTT